MNIFRNFPSIKRRDKVEAEADETQIKKDRIAFHREHVRNGPRKIKYPSTGQVRRAQKRSLETLQRKQRKQQVRAFFAQQQEASLLRAHLVNVGVLPWGTPGRVSKPSEITRSTAWIVLHFGREGFTEITPELLQTSVQQAFDRFAILTGIPSQPIALREDIFA